MKMMKTTALAVLLSATSVFANDYTHGDLTIEQPHAFETSKTANVAGGYMTITNAGATNDRLVEVRTATIARVELHLSETDANGVARMTKQDGIEVPAGGSVTLEPGALHVMFMGLNGDPFEAGETVAATLVFEQAGEVGIAFDVVERRASDHGGMGASGHKMSD